MTAPISIPITQAYSLMSTIYRYQGEWSLYLAQCLEAGHRGEPDEAPAVYELTMHALEKWDRAAENLAEAMMALELAVADYEIGETPRIPAMMKAALNWMKNEQKRSGDVQ